LIGKIEFRVLEERQERLQERFRVLEERLEERLQERFRLEERQERLEEHLQERFRLEERQERLEERNRTKVRLSTVFTTCNYQMLKTISMVIFVVAGSCVTPQVRKSLLMHSFHF